MGRMIIIRISRLLGELEPSVMCMKESDKFVTVKRAARLLGLCCKMPQGWNRANKIPVHRHPISA